MEKYLPILRNSPFFKGLTDNEILSILHCVNATVILKKRDSYIFRAGDSTEVMGCLLYTSASETRETVVNSENFGVDIWGQATVNVNDATEFHTTSAAFLIKSASSVVNISKDATIDASIDANAKAESKLNGTSYGCLLYTSSWMVWSIRS